MKHSQGMHTRHAGFSLIEVLVACALLSTTILVLMTFQSRLLRQIKSIQVHHIALNVQISLFEELLSSIGHIEAEHEIIQKWQDNLIKRLPHTNLQVSKSTFGYQSIFVNNQTQQKIILYGALCSMKNKDLL